MYSTLRESRFTDTANDIPGADVYGPDDKKLGVLEDVILDSETYEARYAVVDASGWLSSQRFIVPVEHLGAHSRNENHFSLLLTRTQIESFPPYDEGLMRSDDAFRTYEQRYLASFPTAPVEKARPSSRWSRFLQRLRGHRPGVQATSPAAGKQWAEVVYGLFQQREPLERAVEGLKEAGFHGEEISAVFPETETAKRYAIEQGTKAPEGAATGGTAGIVLGGTLGWLVGVGALTIPGIGPLLAAGPVVAALAGAGAAGALGGIAGALIGLGMPEYQAKLYESEIRKGGMLLAVHCQDARLVDSATRLLKQNGAQNVYSRSEPKAA